MICWPSVKVCVDILYAECQRSHSTAICPILILWHISSACFTINYLQIIAYGVLDWNMKITDTIISPEDTMNEVCPLPSNL